MSICNPEPFIHQGWPITLDNAAYADARDWMATKRGRLNQIVTKIPVTQETIDRWNKEPGNPKPISLTDLGKHDYLYLDRSRELKVAAAKVAAQQGIALPWEPLDLSITEFDSDQDPKGSVKQHTHCERQDVVHSAVCRPHVTP